MSVWIVNFELMSRKIANDHIVRADSARAYGKYIKASAKETPHATVVHKRNNFTGLVKFPVNKLAAPLRKIGYDVAYLVFADIAGAGWGPGS